MKQKFQENALKNKKLQTYSNEKIWEKSKRENITGKLKTK